MIMLTLIVVALCVGIHAGRKVEFISNAMMDSLEQDNPVICVCSPWGFIAAMDLFFTYTYYQIVLVIRGEYVDDTFTDRRKHLSKGMTRYLVDVEQQRKIRTVPSCMG